MWKRTLSGSKRPNPMIGGMAMARWSIHHRERYYVYALAYPPNYHDSINNLSGVVFYVGKGTGDRIDFHELEAGNRSSVCRCRKCNVIRKIWADGKQVQKCKLLEGVKESEAFAFEQKCILDLYASPYLINKRDNPLYSKQGCKIAPTKVPHRLDEDTPNKTTKQTHISSPKESELSAEITPLYLYQTLTSQEACEALGVTYQTLSRYIKIGYIRKYHRGRNVIFSRADIEELKRWLEEARPIIDDE
jgi:excisionase family DNA binding protein